MPPLHSWGSPTPSTDRKSETDTPPLPSRGPRRGRKWYPCILQGHQCKMRGANTKMATLTLPSRRPTRGRKCCGTAAFSGVPNTKCGEKIRYGYLTRAFSGAH